MMWTESLPGLNEEKATQQTGLVGHKGNGQSHTTRDSWPPHPEVGPHVQRNQVPAVQLKEAT